MKAAIKQETQNANGFRDINSEAASDGDWETLHQEVTARRPLYSDHPDTVHVLLNAEFAACKQVRISGQQGYHVTGRASGWLQQGGYPSHQQQPSAQLAGMLPPSAAHMSGRPGKLANVLKNSQLQITDMPGAKRPIHSGRRSATSSQSHLIEEGVRAPY